MRLRPTLLSLLLTLLAFTLPAGVPMPLAMSANRHYLVDAQGNPFLFVGDSSWGLPANVTGTNINYFFSTRSNQGFNVVLFSLVNVAYTAGPANAQLPDGTLPFTSTVNGVYDLTAENPAYFQEISNLLQIAAANGIVVMLDPLETGGWLSVAVANGPSRCLAYGEYVGNYFSHFTNVIWMNGNDYNCDDPNIVTNDECMTNVAYGIKLAAAGQTQSIEISSTNAPVGGMEDANWFPFMLFSQAYSWSPQYDYILRVYNRSNALPEILGEAHYENESVGYPPSFNNTEYGTQYVIRQQVWWTMLSGGCGHLYGNNYTWTFKAGWQGQMATPAVTNILQATTLLRSVPWWALVPDTNHTVLTAGYGTYTFTGLCSTNDYVTTAWTTNGSLMVSYLPSARAVTVALTNFNGAVRGRWFDPAAGQYSTIAGSPFSNRGTKSFLPPGSNASATNSDWVLVLDTGAMNQLNFNTATNARVMVQ